MTRCLTFESLENRELLSATTWESPAAASVAQNAAVVLSVQAETTPISLATLDVTVEKIEATVASPGSNRVNIEWTSVEGATKYYLMSSTPTDGENYSAWNSLKYVADPGDGSATVSTLLTLTAGKYYKFKVRAVIGNDRTDFTETEEAIVVNKPESPVITSAAVDHTTGIATVEFDTVENAGRYRVDYTFDDGATWQFAKYVYVGEGDATSSKMYIDSDADSAVVTHKLNANKTYNFRVRATNDCGSSEYVVSDPISYKGATAPESVVAQVTEGSHYATIVWSASEDATQYFIESTTNGGASWSGVKKAAADAFTYDEATDSYSYTYFISTGKTYQFRVRAYNNLGTDGVSTESNEVALLTPGTPENFTVASAEAVNPTNYPVGERYSKVTVTLSWDAADNATKYVVRYSKDGGAEKLLKNINDPTVTSVTFGAVAGSYYNFSIIAVNSLGASEPVETGVYGVYKTAFNRVDVVEGETLEATTVAPAGLTTVYKWQFSRGDGNWVDAEVFGYDITGPTLPDDIATRCAQSNVWVRVLVSGSEDDCPAGSYVAEAVAGPVVDSLNAPSDFTFGTYDADNNALQMSWVDNSDNEDGFYVEYSVDAGATWAKAAWLDADVTERVGAIYSGKVYQFRIRAYNADGYSAWAYSDPYEVTAETPSLCVTTLDDVVNEYDNKISLREAIAYATQYPDLGTAITFDSSLNGQTITLVDGALTVAKAMSFIATDQNITVSGGNKSLIFSVSGDDVWFDGLTFTKGSGDNGGAFELKEDTYTAFSSCTFTSNSAGSVGGAVYMNGAEAAFSNCRFSSNSSSDGGGAICLEDDSSAEFDACVFTNNSSDGYGGAFYMTDSGSATFVNTVLIGNEADEGGAIFASDEDVTLKLYHVTLVDNGSQSGGGGISLDSVGSAEIYNSIIYANYDMFGFASNVYANDSNVIAINNLTWIESDDWWTETGWEINGGNVTNTNVIELEDNNSLSSVLNRKTYELVDGSLAINAGDHDLTPEVVTDLNGKDRNSKPDLGAVESDVPCATTLCVNLLEDQSGEWDGGTALSLRQAIAYANNNPEEEYEITFDSSLNGETILLVNGELEISRPITVNGFDQNITISGGGQSRIFLITSGDVTVEGLALTNGSSASGGAVCIEAGVSANFNACVFTSNKASSTGGAVYIDDGSDVTFTNTVFSGNSAGNSNNFFTFGSGGAIYAYGATTTLTLEHTTVVDNAALGRMKSDGGGIYLCDSTGNIYNSIVFKNSAKSSGYNVFANKGATLNAINVLTYNFSLEWIGNSDSTVFPIENIVNMKSTTELSEVLDPTTFQLVDGSAAIDAGDPELTPDVTTDLYGHSRDTQPDLGACEYVASSSGVLDDVFAELVDDLGIDW